MQTATPPDETKPVRFSRPEQVSHAANGAPAERDGFKKTKVGWIPEAWGMATVGQVADTYAGGTPSRSNETNFGGDISWIKSGEVNQGNVRSTEEKLTKEGLDSSSAKFVEPNTVLVAIYGATAGVVGMSKIKATINQAVLAVVPGKRLKNKFLRYALIHVMPRALHVLKQGGQPNLSGRLVKSIKLPLPPLPEQRRIVAVLADWDRALAQTDALLDAKQRRKKALMQQLLTEKTRLPGFEDEAWQEKKLGEVVEVNPRKKSPEDESTPISFVEMSNVSEEAKIVATEELPYREVATGYKAFRNGDVIVAKITPCFENGKGALVEGMRNGRGFGSTEFHVLRPGSDIDQRYLYYQTVSNPFRGKGAGQMAGSAGQQRVRKNFIRTYKFLLPPLPEQRAIAAVLATCDEEIETLRAERDALKRQKKGMMQKLLTGRVRVGEDDDLAPQTAA